MSTKKNSVKFAKKSAKSNISFIIILGIILMLVLFGTMAQLLGYVQFSDEFAQEYTENAFRIANAAESYIIPDYLDEYLEKHGNSSLYRQTYQDLTNLCNKVNARFIYVIQPDETYDNITFVFNAVNDDSGFEPYEIGYVRPTTNDDYKLKYQLLYEGLSDKAYVLRDRGFIETDSHITAMIPLKDNLGKVRGILCVQRQMDALTKARFSYMIKMLVVLLSLIIMATFLYDLFLKRYLIKPLRKITKETTRFASSQSKAESKLTDKIKSNNEIGQLAASVDKMESETLTYIDNLTRVTAESQRIGTELAVAAGIQQGMLDAVAPDRDDVSIYATMSPAKEVGGDFYDYFMIDDDHMGIVIADVSGKGVPASLFMAITKMMINDRTMIHKSPAKILEATNERICKNNKLDMFITVWLGILELSTGKILAANAGHEYPAVYRNGKGFELLKDKHGFVVGGMSGVHYKDYELTLKPGEALFLYTDGVPEATSADNELFGVERMVKALNVDPEGTPEEILANVQDAVDKFVDKAPQFDDLTMLCVRYRGSEDVNK
jgi:sigma-B regulation protein RsbU (phosphoserine phosphatase)